MKRFEEYYQREMELEEKYEAVKEDEAEAEKIRAEYKAMCDEINAEGDIFVAVHRLYKSMKDRGNTYIDIDEPYMTRKVPELIAAFREYGIQFFTFSSTWSGAAETAWEFTKNGCTLSGMIELNDKSKGFMNDEYEKIHGYLFRTM